MQHIIHLLNLVVAFGALRVARAYDISRNDNIVTYWGQNSYGATHESDTRNWQQRLSAYCEDDTINAFPIAFVDQAFSTGNAPHMDLSNSCNSLDSRVLKGTSLLDCSSMADDIKACQAKGKSITISLGGATGGAMFDSDAQAKTFADTVWNTFLGGSGKNRPFGSAVLDGVDLDIEGGSNTGYAAFVKQLRSHFAGASKKFYITGAPQCPYPDEYLGSALNEAEFDAVYVQFYNNYCQLSAYNDANAWNFDSWDKWAKTISPNKDVKVYIGALASPSAGGAGYVNAATLAKIAKEVQAKYSSFGGVMFWDVSQVYNNGRIDKTVKAAMSGGAAPAPAPSTTATTSKTSAKTSTRMSTSRISTATGTKTATQTATSTGTSVTGLPTVRTVIPSGQCTGVKTWATDSVYVADEKVVYNGHVYAAKWWTTGEVPGTTGQWGVWVDKGSCSAKRDEVADADAPALPVPSRDPRLGIAPVKTASRSKPTAVPLKARSRHSPRFAKSRH